MYYHCLSILINAVNLSTTLSKETLLSELSLFFFGRCARRNDKFKRIDYSIGATGLLKGRKASTNWFREEAFLKKYGAIPTNERYTQDGKYWTSAGVTAGMDMSLVMMNMIYGEAYAQAIMSDMEYDPAPPIEGGSVEKTSPAVVQMIEAMYGQGLDPLIDSLERIH